MKKVLNDPALRIKITGACNRSCCFCNEEGDMRNIDQIDPSSSFFECVHEIMDATKIKRIMLTGGEPTIHPNLSEIVSGIDAESISITTNGIRTLTTDKWSGLAKSGLGKVIVSIHDATPQTLIQVELRPRNFGWATRSIESQRINLINASQVGLGVRVNVVAHNSKDQVLSVLDSLTELQIEHRFDIRILNDLSNVIKSQHIIREVCTVLEAHEIQQEKKVGSSNVSVLWETESGFMFSTKTSFPYYFESICEHCPIKKQCHEGFYGLRLEKRGDDYWIRLCIYKNGADVLMPWKQFISSRLIEQFLLLCQNDSSTKPNTKEKSA